MIINGVELDIDFTDADILERIENGSKEVFSKAEELKGNKDLSPAEGIRQECKILKDFLDYVLGDGTSEKLFKGKDSLKQCLQAFEDIINAKQTAMSDFQAKVGKYSPDRLKR
jgi:hypothetical protein